jgi:hypothetical protein
MVSTSLNSDRFQQKVLEENGFLLCVGLYWGKKPNPTFLDKTFQKAVYELV